MPGLGAGPAIFENIKLPTEIYEMHLLEWEIPTKGETLQNYAERMSKLVMPDNAVLVGVSFGGVLVQEMAKYLNLKRLIIISSIKSNLEMPLGMKVIKSAKAYKLVPTSLLQNMEILSKFSFGSAIKQRLKLYEKYLSVRDKSYLEWAIEQMLLWERTKADPKVIHIHGDADGVFPIKNIKNCITIKGGTHIMILNKYKWLNENLPKIILGEFQK